MNINAINGSKIYYTNTVKKTPSFKENESDKFVSQNKYNTSFQAKINNQSIKRINSKSLTKAAIAVLLPLSIMQMCSSPRSDSKTNMGKYNIEYFDIKPETKNEIEKSLKDFENRTENIDFMDGIQIDITKKFEDLNDNNVLRRVIKTRKHNENIFSIGGVTLGESNFEGDIAPRGVCISETSHGVAKLRNLFKNGNYSANKEMDFTLMHELGHQFNDYYGSKRIPDLAQKYNKIQSRLAQIDSMSIYGIDYPVEILTDEEKITLLNYLENCRMSDKEEFKEAYLKDLSYISELKQENAEKLADNLERYIFGIDEYARGEVYANLFAYATSKDDGDKERFLDNFKNCYEIVKKDIKDKIGYE